jgi:hypothetical protein
MTLALRPWMVSSSAASLWAPPAASPTAALSLLRHTSARRQGYSDDPPCRSSACRYHTVCSNSVVAAREPLCLPAALY